MTNRCRVHLSPVSAARAAAIAAPLATAAALLASMAPAPAAAAGTPAGATGAPADAAPVWVFFHDARAQPADIGQTELTDRALARRALRRTLPGLYDSKDVAVDQRLLVAVASTGATPRVTSRWLHAVSAMATRAQAAALRALPGVDHVEPVGRGRAGWQHEEQAPPPAGNGFASTDYGAALGQLQQIGVTAMHARGFTGRDVVIGILDTGFHRTHQAFHSEAHPLQVIAERDFINDDGNTGIEPGDPSNQHMHGTWILGTIASWLPGQLVGGAYEAKFVLCKTEVVPSETPIEEDFYVAGLEFAEAHGADVCTSSLGYIDWYTQADLNGHTCVTTMGVNQATANGMVCCTAAGNEGHDADPATSTIIAPADAYKVITCGAVDSTGTPAWFTSSGPTADGRVKPEILAQGVATASVHATDATGLQWVNGTSLSTPLVAAAMACIVQARPDRTVDQLRAALIATASRSDDVGPHPDPLFVEGYGILRALEVARNGRHAADLNLDGRVNGADLGMVLGAWSSGDPLAGDVTGDGLVNGADLGAVLGAWAP